MAEVRIPNTIRGIPSKASVRTLRPVHAGSLSKFAEGANYLGVYRTSRLSTNLIAYQNMDSILTTPPGFGSGTLRTYKSLIRPSHRGKHLSVRFTYQATTTQLSGPVVEPSIKVSLVRVSDEAIIDHGYAIPRDSIQINGLFPNDDNYAPRDWKAPSTVDPTAGVIQTGPRLLNIDDNQAELLYVFIETRNVRILSITVQEYVLRTQDQVFS